MLLLAAVWPAASLCRRWGYPSSEGRQHQCVLLAPLPPAAVPLLTPLHLLHSADLTHRSRCRQRMSLPRCRLAPLGQPPGPLAGLWCCCLPPQCRQQWQPPPPLPPPLQCAAAVLLPPVGSTLLAVHTWLCGSFAEQTDWIKYAVLKHDNIECASVAVRCSVWALLHVLSLHLRAL